MKTLVACFLLLTAIRGGPNMQIMPLLGIPFGQIVELKAQFVNKDNDYYSQNFIDAPYMLKVLEVNKRRLATPVVVEAQGVLEWETVKPDMTYAMRGYEVVSTIGTPANWDAEAAQIDYRIVHKIVIQLP